MKNKMFIGTRFLILAIIITIIAVALVNSAIVSSSRRSIFGERCSKTVRCKSQSWLTCDPEEKICRCSKPDEMEYDSGKEQCVVLIGERCKYTFQEDEEDSRLFTEDMECISNSECDEEAKLCKCPEGTYSDSEGKECFPLKSVGESCEYDEECDSKNLHKCVDGTCGCDTDHSVLNLRSYSFNQYPGYSGYSISVPSNICVKKAGESCSSESREYCIENAECYNEQCECISSTSQTSDGFCAMRFGKICSSTTPCMKGYQCVYGKCACPNPDLEINEEHINKPCARIVGAICDPDTTSCVQDSHCTNTEDDQVYRCRCQKGFVESTSGQCDIEYGHHCNYEDTEKHCDSVSKLVCKDDSCQCKNNLQVYEPNRRKCSYPLESSCKDWKDCVDNAQCVSNATNYPQSNGLSGRCQCGTGYFPVDNSTCSIIKNNIESE